MKIENLLKAAWFCPGLNGRRGVNLLLEGPPGSGKTSRIGQIAGGLGLGIETVIASIREPADFLGLPVPNGTGSVDYLPGKWAARMAKAGQGVVFFDELTTAPPAVQAACLRVLTEGVVGDLALPPGVRFIAAANPTSQAANGYDLSLPMANRFCHLGDVGVSVDDWAEWVLSGANSSTPTNGASPGDLDAKVDKAWAEPFARASGLMVSFLRRSRDKFLAPPDGTNPEASKAWPSGRSWEMAMRLLASAEVHGLSEVEADALVAGCIGQGTATTFMAWRKEMDLPDPAELLDGKGKFSPDSRIDRTQAVLASCAALVAPPAAPDRVRRATALYSILKPYTKKHADVVVTVVKTLINAKLGQFMPDAKGKMGVVAEAAEVFKSIKPALQAMGFES